MSLQENQQSQPERSVGEIVYSLAFDDGLRPDAPLSVSEWADQYRRLSARSAAEPGQWRTDRTPYLREIMDCLSPSSEVERVVVMAGAQLGKTEAGNNWLGYIIYKALGPTLAVLPTVDMAKRSSKQRIEPLIEETPVLRGLVRDARDRDSGNTMLQKEFPGGLLILTGANSATGLRSMPARNLFLDEVDAYPENVDEEGDPVNLAIARSSTFPRRKILLTSTPKIKGRSRIESAYEASDKRRFYVPCPRCNAFQHLKFAQLRWAKNEPDKAAYQCEHCEGMIQHHEKTWMLERGEWRAEARFDGKVAGFQINSLYSPVGWLSWGEIAARFLEAKDRPILLQSFVNLVLGETWADAEEAMDWRRLYDRQEDYQLATCPAGVRVLFAGCDVQRNRLEVYVYGYGQNLEQWLVDQIIIPGSVYDTDSPDSPWLRLSEVMNLSYPSASGAALPIQKLAIDSGFEAPLVYAWASNFPVGRVLVCKGVQRGDAPATASNNLEYADKRRGNIRLAHQLWLVSTIFLKDQFYGWLKRDAPTREALEKGATYPAGYFHTPRMDESYFRQIASEVKVKGVYEKLLHERNEALDTKILADVAAWLMGVHRWHTSQWTGIEQRYQTPDQQAAGTPQPEQRQSQQPRRRGWQTMGRW